MMGEACLQLNPAAIRSFTQMRQGYQVDRFLQRLTLQSRKSLVAASHVSGCTRSASYRASHK